MNQKYVRNIWLYSLVIAFALLIVSTITAKNAIAEGSTNTVSEDQQDNSPGTNSVSEDTQDTGTDIHTNPVSEETQDGGTGITTNPVSEETQDGAGGGDPSKGGGSHGGGGHHSSGSTRSSSGNTGSDSQATVISNIKVMLLGSDAPTATLVKGATYVISWNSSVRGAEVSIILASASNGPTIFIGTNENQERSGVNSMNWIVPASVASGNYFLRFTDIRNNTTDAEATYRIVSSSQAGNGGVLGTGGGKLPGEGVSSSEITDFLGENTSETSSVVNGENVEPSQTANALNAIRDFLNNKYVLWFFVLLLVIAGILLMRERKEIKK